MLAGGLDVRLRVPAPAAVGDESEQLGLSTPGFEDVPLGRGAFRKANSVRVLLVSASAVERACAGGSSSVEAMFAGAAGGVVGETLYGIEAWVAMRAGNSVYGYALTLVAPVA